MQIHGPGHVHGPHSISGPHRSFAPREAANSGGVQQLDQLDISPEADLVSRTQELPSIRQERVSEIRAQIEAGTYETPEKLEIALGRLLDEIS